MWLIDGSTYAPQIEAIKKYLAKQNVKPSMDSVKYHLLNYLLLPTELLDEPERSIILRAKCVEM